MSKPAFSRTLVLRVLYTSLAWLGVILSLFAVSTTLGDAAPNNVLWMITAATGLTAVLFRMALQVPRIRKIAGIRNVERGEIRASWSMYPMEIRQLAIFPTIANLFMLWAFELIKHMDAAKPVEDWSAGELMVPPLMGAALGLYILAVNAILSMRRKAWPGSRHRPVLGVVLASWLTATVCLLPSAFMGAASAMTLQVLVTSAITGAMTVIAALITLKAVSAAK
ncbi:hypothetical protein ACQPZP_09390 [Spirillospora sp. CA-142024]|uniref:hypothetical protein n=1 Tax=Spirillospora sp. CA-142024 TaxID=3240036 RepID=UPI003D941935